MNNILLVSSIPVVLMGLSAITEEVLSDGANIFTATSFTGAKEVFANMQITMMVLDLDPYGSSTPIQSIIDELSVILNRYPMLKVVLLYEKWLNGPFERMYKLGIRGFIEKITSLVEMQACLLAVSSDGVLLENNMQTNFMKVSTAPTKSGVKHAIKGLTKQETLVALLLIDGKSSIQVSLRLKLRPSTVLAYKQRILKKLRLSNLSERE